MLIKGFIKFEDYRIPFVIENYRMELFGDEDVLPKFSKEYNFKTNYELEGVVCENGYIQRDIVILVEYSLANICYLTCYIIAKVQGKLDFNKIKFYSSYLDDVLRFKYSFLDKARSGVNLTSQVIELYNFPFIMRNQAYEMIYEIGNKYNGGIGEDFRQHGTATIELADYSITECYQITILMFRYIKFMTAFSEITFESIKLCSNDYLVAIFYCKYIGEKQANFDIFFHELDVAKFSPKILGNLALDLGNKIEKSIPLGHIKNFHTYLTPQRFIEQIMSFEYLYAHIEPKKTQKHLKSKLVEMLDRFPVDIYPTKTHEEVAEAIKELRRKITHGYTYYYNFENSDHSQRYLSLMDELIEKMSLCYIGFSVEDISQFCRLLI